MKITKNTTLEKILEQNGGEDVLHKNNVPCMSCPYAEMELAELKLGDVCKMYELDLEKILGELNKK